MSYAAHEGNREMSLQEQTASAVQQALKELKSKKRKRDAMGQNSEMHPNSKRLASSSDVNGNGHDTNIFVDNMPNSSGSSQDFSTLSQQLQASINHGLPGPSNASSTAAAALAGIIPQMTIPQPTEMSFASTGSATDGDRQMDSSFDMGNPDNGQGHHAQGMPYNMGSYPGNTAAQLQAARETSNGGGVGGNKPSVGSDEWHKVRRDNHKEVERRRRETINEGINELAKIVPGCEKNKGSILQRAVEYINQLKSNERRNIEKWTGEKELTEGVLVELTHSVESLKNELDRSQRETAMWKKVTVDAGLASKVRDELGNADAEADTDS
ncbi:MAG: hypothetical protein Q9167_003289 [Letrouitia subvulpina]